MSEETTPSSSGAKQEVKALEGELSQSPSSGTIESTANNTDLVNKVNGLDVNIQKFHLELESLKIDALRVEKTIDSTSRFITFVTSAVLIVFTLAAIPLFRDFYKDNSELYRKAIKESVQLNEKVNHLEKMYKSSCNL